ncbi:MAG: nitrate reductase catalytic subunit [Bacteroidetes bacterium RIFCSPLOWO2_02_FULL_36_8]|nr:MAG: nitrate reductase catalytic subunit [Bacteroidetes bacterium RIFCSPLOWO2_02_FULL_36_8]OFY69568.1 MAG: nitrate reductase catalytic subunit [Bacteroidetes bacterium RIFCSPLOWO2_12_FULL_37_12]
MKNSDQFSRRDFVKLGVAGATVGAFTLGGWAFTEFIVDEGTTDTWHKSVCRFCGTGCGVMLGMQGKKLTRIRGDENAHNKGVICIKGALLAELMKIPNRLLIPKIRKNGKLVSSTWEEAMQLVAEKFKSSIDNFGPDSVAYYGSGQLFTEESYTANKLFKAGIETNNVDSNARLCMASAATGYVQTFGKDEPMGSYEDIDHADCFFIIGSNTYECHPPIWERIRIRKSVNPNVKIIVVDPRNTKTAQQADLHLAVVPGTDLLLLNAMLYLLVKCQNIDRKFIDEHVQFMYEEKKVGFEDWVAFLDDYKPELVAEELGLSVKEIQTAAHWFGTSKASMSLWTMGINQRIQGVFLNNTLNSLHLVTGNICRPGATPLSLTGQCNACGGIRDTGSLSHLLPGGRFVQNEKDRNDMEKLWEVPEGTFSERPGYHAMELFQAMVDEKVKTALIMCSNPAQSLPNLNHYIPGLEKCFLVVADIFENTETANYADVLLPTALYIEKTGVLGQTERRYQLVEKLIEPPGSAKSDLEILVDLAERLGHGKLIKSKTTADVWDEWRKISAESKYDFSGITYERLKNECGIQWPCPDVSHPGTKRRYAKGDPFVEEGKEIQFYGKENNRAIVFLRPYIKDEEQLTDEHPFYLTTGRVIEQWHTGTMTDKISELKNASKRGKFILNPIDAHRLGITENDLVVVTSKKGKIEGPVSISDNETPGVIFASFFDSSFLINKIVNDQYDPVSKEPNYKVTAVSISKVKNTDI